ncbi:MAG: nuclear transport factor 2 family protein [Bacteroidota bacterium]|nr:nuclear transport factor 2 family protein [Bacteroidota bacterium]
MRFLPLFFTLLSFSICAQTDQDKEILSIVDHFFQAMADRDTAALHSIMTADGIFHAVPQGSDREPRAVSHQQFIADLAKGEEKLLERYWEPEVWIGEGIATVCAEYDFHVDGKRSHCGTDVFTFVRTKAGWKISGGVFNMKKEGCAESPLGPVE